MTDEIQPRHRLPGFFIAIILSVKIKKSSLPLWGNKDRK